MSNERRGYYIDGAKMKELSAGFFQFTEEEASYISIELTLLRKQRDESRERVKLLEDEIKRVNNLCSHLIKHDLEVATHKTLLGRARQIITSIISYARPIDFRFPDYSDMVAFTNNKDIKELK